MIKAVVVIAIAIIGFAFCFIPGKLWGRFKKIEIEESIIKNIED